MFTTASAGLVTLLLIPLGCSSSSGYSTPTPGGAACDGVSSTSSVVDAHTHTICVLQTDLSSPPASGASFQSSNVGGHTHMVVLTQTDLTMIAGGGSVTVTSSLGEGGQAAHEFTIMKA
jgi:hypothetical protein